MVKRKGVDDDRGRTVDTAPRARGGVSAGGILTGVVVAFGALFLLSAIIGGVIAATVAAAENATSSDVIDAGIGGAIAFVAAQFLAYLWGGYTAGRMARGAGVANGLLVPIVAILLALAVGAIAAGLGATAELNVPWGDVRLPLENNYAIDLGAGLAIAAVIAMVVGGVLGGLLGARWHTKLERRAADEVEARQVSARRDESAPPPSHSDERATAADREGARTPARQPPR
jgi:hypothetical protein